MDLLSVRSWDRLTLFPSRGHEQPDQSQEDARGIDQSLRAPTLPGGILCAQPRKFARRISQRLPAPGLRQCRLCRTFSVCTLAPLHLQARPYGGRANSRNSYAEGFSCFGG